MSILSECTGTENWKTLGLRERLKEETNFWRKAELLKKLILAEKGLHIDSPKKSRLIAYQSGFPNSHPLQRQFRAALISLENTGDTSPESSNRYSEACWELFCQKNQLFTAGFCFAHFFDMKQKVRFVKYDFLFIFVWV